MLNHYKAETLNGQYVGEAERADGQPVQSVTPVGGVGELGEFVSRSQVSSTPVGELPAVGVCLSPPSAGRGSRSVRGPKPYSIGPRKYRAQAVSPVKVHHVGIDSLWLSYKLHSDMFASLQGQLADWKEQAGASDEGKYLVESLGMYMMARGRRNYQYVLIVPEVCEIAITTSPVFPPVRVRIYSRYLLEKGLAGADASVRGYVAALVGEAAITEVQVSEVHIATDATGLVPTMDMVMERRFITHADNPVLESYDGPVLHSMRWGGKSSSISVAWYNKVKEINEKSPDKEYMLDVWRSGGWNPDTDGDVRRLEVRFTRDILRQLSMNSVQDIDVPALLRFALGDGDNQFAYLSLCDVSPSDTNRARWAVNADWLALVDGAIKLYGGDQGVVLRRGPARVPQKLKLARMAGGCISSYSALIGNDDPSVAVREMFADYLDSLDKKGVDWYGVQQDKQMRYMVLHEQSLAIVAARAASGRLGSIVV